MRPGQRLTVDHIEGDLAVVQVDAGPAFDLPLWLLPRRCREADVLRVTAMPVGPDRMEVTIEIDSEATEAARQAAADRLQRLRETDPGGDLSL